MALVNNRRQRLATLCALYVAQGVPWGFMTITLVAYLTSQGISAAEAGRLTAIVLVPWTFKLVWAPIIDSVTLRSMGRRRVWIIGAELMMAATLLGFLLMSDPTEDLRMLGWMFFIHNCFASLQDVCTDALAVDVLPVAEQPSANAMMWGSKLIGKGAGAALLASVMKYWGLPTAVMVQVALLLAIMLFPLLILERPGEKRLPWSRGKAMDVGPASSFRSPMAVIVDLVQGFSLRATLAFALFGGLKLIGSGVNEIVTKTLYTQDLGWKFDEFAHVQGLYGTLFTVAGAILAGVLANRFGRRTMMTFGIGGFALFAIAFASCPQLWQQRWFTTAYLLAGEGLLAIASVGFLSMAMRICWTQAAATMFTTYMTLSNVGHVIGNWLAGPVRDNFSYETTFGMVAVASFVPLLCLPLVEPMQVDRFKYPEPLLEAEPA